MNLRVAEERDIERIGRMWEKLAMLHHDLDQALPPAAMGGGRVYARRLIGRLNDPLTRIVVVEDEERLVGFALAVIIDVIPDMFVQENSGLLADIFVEETHRRCGVGRLMVEDIKAWLKANGVRCFEWHVAEKNPAGRKFWEAMGGERVMVRMRAGTG